MNTELQKARKETGLTQVQVAKRAGISNMSYHRYENGERVPNAYTVQLIAKALNTTVEEIFPLSPDNPH